MKWTMKIAARLLVMVSLAMTYAAVAPVSATAQTSEQEAMLVVYGPHAPSREGDADRREQIFFSVPADMRERLFVRLFDPETYGSDDFTYGGPADSVTYYRVFGGDGAFSQAERPEMVEDGRRGGTAIAEVPITGPGQEVLGQNYGAHPGTDGYWVTMGDLRARQGEVIGDRAYFRIDIQGATGNDGNGYSVAVSLSRDSNVKPEGLDMFSYQPTIRWARGNLATRLGFDGSAGGPFTVQSFDTANGTLLLVKDYDDESLAVSGQDLWAVSRVDTSDTNLALSLADGFETPNDVTVAVFDGSGAPIGLRMPPYRDIVPSRPTAVGLASPLADCRSVAFDGNGSYGRTALSHIWEFGDGNSSPQSVIAHRYDTPGRYIAQLRVLESGSRPGRGDWVDVPVHVRPAPIARAGEAITVAPGTHVSFDGSGSVASDSPITSYHWSFGDGTEGWGPHAQKTYHYSGLFNVVLRVEDSSGHPCDFGVATRQVKVNFQPVAEGGTDQKLQVGQTLRFSADASFDSDGVIQSYRWDMGDGTVYDTVDITHNYSQPGLYKVVLTVTDDSGVANGTDTDPINIRVNAPPVPLFDAPEPPVLVSEAVRFDASRSYDADGSILSYLWDFGDGATGDGQIVDYAWTAPGIYRVSLTVTDDSGTGSAVQRTAMDILVDGAPVAEAGPDQFVTASDVRFDGTGSRDVEGGISAYLWEFGDGTTGTGPTPIHTYARPGTYQVSLAVFDESGSHLNTDKDTLTVTINASPIADAGPPQIVAPMEEFVLSGRSSIDPDGSIADYLWTLPDGSTKPGQRIATTLDTPGLYRIGLRVSDDFVGGAASDQSEVLITVNAQPVAEAGADILVAPGDFVSLDADQSYDPDGKIVSYLWEFDDLETTSSGKNVVRTYDRGGVWTAQLVVTDDSGVANATAIDDVTIRVNSAPVAEAGPAIDSEALQITLDGSGSTDADGDNLIYRWDLGDGSPVVFGQSVTHVYPRSGIYPVTLRVDDATGLSNATAIDATVVTIKTRPVALAGLNRDVCSGQPILFDASASVDPDGGLLLYSWDFGDGDGSDLVNPTKVYEQPGAYPVTLTVRNGTGSDWGTDVARIAALVREGPIADAGADMTVCTNQPVRFDGSGSTDADGAVNAFAWTFGDGGTASGERPEYRFRNPGTYAVNLTITGEALGTCSPLDTDIVNVQVVAAPEQEIVGSDRAAAGMPASFTAVLGDLGGASILSQSWRFEGGGSAEGSEVSHIFAEPGVYFVTLVTDLAGGNQGCSSIETRRKVIVNEAPVAMFEGPERVAAGEVNIFDAGASVDNDGALIGYLWDFGDGTTASGVQVAQRYEAEGSYTISLTVTDNAEVGNSAAVMRKEITVNPAPVAALQTPVWACAAQPVPFAVSVPDSTSVTWQFGDGASATGSAASHSFDTPGLYPVQVTLDDGAGLANSLRREESYVRVNAAPTALAGQDRVICPGQTIGFDASASSDLDGNIVTYDWIFSDGITLSGARVSRRFDAAGEVTARLVVRDNSGLTCGVASDTASVLVNATPVVSAGPDLSVKLGGAHDDVTFTAMNASDADGQGLSFAWDFGDGNRGTGASVRHSYTAPGAYIVTVRAQDTTGLSCGIGTDTAVVRASVRE